MRTAAVLGREFPLRLLDRVWDGPGALHPHLLELKRLEFVYERAGAEEPVYVFKHALTQDVAYEGLLTHRRQALHGAAGRALEELYADRLDEVDGALAYHYARSEVADKAVTYLVRLADKAARVYANTDALTHLTEALAHLERLPEGRARDRLVIDIALRQGFSLYFLGRFAESVDRRHLSFAVHPANGLARVLQLRAGDVALGELLHQRSWDGRQQANDRAVEDRHEVAILRASSVRA